MERAKAEPVAWLHTLHMEGGQTYERVTQYPESAFGTPGKDHSEEYRVSSVPLYATPQPAAVDGLVEAAQRLLDSLLAGALGSVKQIEAMHGALEALRQALAQIERKPEDGNG